MKDSTLHQKLENIVRAGKPKTIRHEGKTYYISKEKIRECEKCHAGYFLILVVRDDLNKTCIKLMRVHLVHLIM